MSRNEKAKVVNIKLHQELKGTILDIGGGGEGVIGRLYGNQVVAIDNRQEELDEVPECCRKLLMDATEMTFEDNCFDNATLFYSLMFMSKSSQQKALCEAARVVKPSGEVHIWDCNINSAYPDPFCIDVKVQLPESKIQTTYGVGKLDVQNVESIKEICELSGLKVYKTETDGLSFFIKCKKK